MGCPAYQWLALSSLEDIYFRLIRKFQDEFEADFLMDERFCSGPIQRTPMLSSLKNNSKKRARIERTLDK